jgi:predicted transcriptional regulator of viral defense system
LRAGADVIMKTTRYKIKANFIRALLNEEIIRSYKFKAKNGKSITLDSSVQIDDFSPYEMAVAMFPKGYFCNLSAVYYQSLTNQIPNTVYVCTESNAKKSRANDELTNSKLRQAFLKPHRHTQFVFDFRGCDIAVIERMEGTDSGVVSSKDSSGFLPSSARIAGVERALIDAVMCPQYNGGVSSIPDYLKHARGKIDIGKLIRIYRELDFVYPYFQAIGFFLERTGMAEMAGALRAEFTPENKFYIDHSAKASWKYDDRWLIYYPEGIVDEY